ncbi:hypothetical protein BDZ91DRAFT_69669 [Kalaharituber pfeilii]|nr:hypothetical protein BDZ91DRAFT_69669 [Kalaharituber pfeilii]
MRPPPTASPTSLREPLREPLHLSYSPPLWPPLLPLLSTLIFSCRTVTAYYGADNTPTSASTISAYNARTCYFSASGISACRTPPFALLPFALLPFALLPFPSALPQLGITKITPW